MESGRIEPLRALPVHRILRKREDNLFEVGIEGVALNPNRK